MLKPLSIVVAALALSGCVGALMLDQSASAWRPGPPLVRSATLTPDEAAAGCRFTNWFQPFGFEEHVLWTVLDPGGHDTGVNAGGLMEIVCPSPWTTIRACVLTDKPVVKGVYDKKTYQLLACKRGEPMPNTISGGRQ